MARGRKPLSPEAKEAKRQKLKEEAIKFAQEHGRSPTVSDMRFNAVLALYPSWNDFLADCGLKINRQRDISKEKLIKQCQQLAAELGKTPTIDDFNKHDKTPCDYTVRKHFGSWNKFLKECGLPLNQAKK